MTVRAQNLINMRILVNCWVEDSSRLDVNQLIDEFVEEAREEAPGEEATYIEESVRGSQYAVFLQSAVAVFREMSPGDVEDVMESYYEEDAPGFDLDDVLWVAAQYLIREAQLRLLV